MQLGADKESIRQTSREVERLNPQQGSARAKESQDQRFDGFVMSTEVLQGRKGADSDLLGHGENSLECLPVCCHAPGKPHADTVSKNALYGAIIQGHKQFLCEMVVSE